MTSYSQGERFLFTCRGLLVNLRECSGANYECAQLRSRLEAWVKELENTPSMGQLETVEKELPATKLRVQQLYREWWFRKG